MELGMIGLGKMGGNMARRLARGGHQVLVYDHLADEAHRLSEEEPGITAAGSMADFGSRLSSPRTVWIMVPEGEATEQTVEGLVVKLEAGDTIIDGGNSFYKDTMRRAQEARQMRLHYIDVGTSGGVWGLDEGYSLMVGGAQEAVERIRPILQTLAPAQDRGWGHVGPSGAGHFVKMVHNGIEYGMMQAYAEGFEILKTKKEFTLDLHEIAQIWRHGSVVRSWLLDLLAQAFSEDQELGNIKGWVSDSGEGRWTVKEAMDLDVPAPVISLALLMRFVSRQDDSFAAKLLATMRNQFGGHEVKGIEERKAKCGEAVELISC